MTSPEPSPASEPVPPATSESTELEQALAEAEALLNQLKQRYQQVQSAQHRRTELQAQLGQEPSPTEVQHVQQQLEQLEMELESRLITWRDQRELFWQFLRFAGVGFGGALLLNALIR